MSTCPRCMNKLTRDKRYGGDFDICTDCGGTWAQGNELDAIIKRIINGDKDEIEASAKALQSAKQYSEAPEHCPSCDHKPLEPFTYGQATDVQLNRCKICGGIWFDPGEMETVALLVAKLFSMSPGSFKGFDG